MISATWRLLSLPVVLILLAPKARAVEPPTTTTSRKGMVVSVSPDASDAGLAVLKLGGTAVDAAIATALSLAVTFPEAGNIGGGGFMMVYPGNRSEPVCIEYRETAPGAATKTMFAADASHIGHRTVGVPGTLRGLGLAHGKYGKLPWKTLVEPAVKLAADGFSIDAAVAEGLNKVLTASKEFAELRRVYGKAGGGDWQAGDRLLQPDLAATLRHIANEGPQALYEGTVADQLIAEMQAGGGLISSSDLTGYQANLRQPIHGTFRGYDVYSSPPPSSGGTCLVEMLNVLENFDLRKLGSASPESMHLIVEAMRRAYCDRARYLGDPGFTSIPKHLTSKAYAKELAASIDLKHATPSSQLAPELDLAKEGPSTTHFSVIDSSGMAVANTYTLQASYGSRVVVRGAGFLLNNEMTDFNWRPGHTDRAGTIGTDPNLIAPGKRMLSSQCPTLVVRDGRLVLVTGSPGGRTIPNTTLCVVLNVLEFGMDLRSAVDAPRLHHQWFPDQINFEGVKRAEFSETVAKLRALGHVVNAKSPKQGDAHSIWIVDGSYQGAADYRRTEGKAAGY